MRFIIICTISLLLISCSRPGYDEWIQGHNYYDDDDFGNAIKMYTKAIELSPTYWVAYSDRGLSKHNLGLDKEAIIDYEIAIMKGNLDCYYNMAFSKLALGDTAGACGDWNISMKIKPEDSFPVSKEYIEKYCK